MKDLSKTVDTLSKRVQELEKQNQKLKPVAADFADLDKQVVDSIKKKAPEILKEVVQKELADFVWETKINVQSMKNEQVNQIKAGVVRELKELIS